MRAGNDLHVAWDELMTREIITFPNDDLLDWVKVHLPELVNGVVSEGIHSPAVSLVDNRYPLVNGGYTARAESTERTVRNRLDFEKSNLVTYGGYMSRIRRVS